MATPRASRIKLRTPATREQVLAAWSEFQPLAQHQLPRAPAQPVEFLAAEDRPQPQLDRMRGAGMATTVGRLRPCSLLDWKFTVLSHNTIRGAAGAALLNAELLMQLGKLSAHDPRSDGCHRMKLVVMKFGGTSVEDAAAIRRTADIVAGRVARGLQPVVVVSAMATRDRPVAECRCRSRARGQGRSTRGQCCAACPPSPRRRRVDSVRQARADHELHRRALRLRWMSCCAGSPRWARSRRAPPTSSLPTANASPATSSPLRSARAASRLRTSMRATASLPTRST